MDNPAVPSLGNQIHPLSTPAQGRRLHRSPKFQHQGAELELLAKQTATIQDLRLPKALREEQELIPNKAQLLQTHNLELS